MQPSKTSDPINYSKSLEITPTLAPDTKKSKEDSITESVKPLFSHFENNSSIPLDPNRLKLPELSDRIREMARSGRVSFTFQGGDITDFLRNQATCPEGIVFEGNKFICAEAAFHWKKWQLAAVSDPRVSEFHKANGEAALTLGQYFMKTYGFNCPSWKEERVLCMWAVLNAKFDQNPTLKNLLNETLGAEIINHNDKEGIDPFWSDNMTGNGLNILGKMLMAIRDGKPCPIE